MRFSTVFISSAVVLAGMSTALAIEKDDMLVARFVDSDLGEVEARGFDEESELYARGGALSRLTGGNKLPSYRDASRDPPPRYTPGDEQMAPPHVRQAWNTAHRPTNYANNRKSPSYTQASNPRHRGRRSYYDDDELMARGNTPSKAGGGDKEGKDGKPPKYKVAKKDPPPPYEGSPDHIPFLDSFQTETDYSNNPKSATNHGAHSQPHRAQSHRSPSPHGSHGPHGSASPHGSHGSPHGSHGPHRAPSPHHRRSFYDLD